jgi:hypothetical protein
VTLSHLQSLVGPPPARSQTYRRKNGGMVEWAWRDTLSDQRGWWFAVTAGDRVLEIAWSAGDEDERDDEIRRAVAKHMGGVPVEVSP